MLKIKDKQQVLGHDLGGCRIPDGVLGIPYGVAVHPYVESIATR
jgi:hypothetical protein